MQPPIIRPIEEKDNTPMAAVIRTVLESFDAPKEGTAYADTSLENLYDAYSTERAVYFVVEENGKIIGGAGIAPLAGGDENTCELQKMYYLPEARNRGIGTTMIKRCLVKARELGYEKCYLETMPNMTAAQKLYAKNGFEYLDGPMGNTGHHACQVQMLLQL
ncbi:GNAT family N-acetyltransferase [Luteirhabdus pelagi]|uniref:GNAT family N-acetyltransferase n=1 Tax=Luteirhabdus pelagi TaxID=2792783 RepID=UPI00193AB312|nr:GNAT family N-acetyltransferase [Luteirhabdus pelagi]